MIKKEIKTLFSNTSFLSLIGSVGSPEYLLRKATNFST